MSGKYALIIGNTEYIDPGLAQLTAPGKDSDAFARGTKVATGVSIGTASAIKAGYGLLFYAPAGSVIPPFIGYPQSIPQVYCFTDTVKILIGAEGKMLINNI